MIERYKGYGVLNLLREKKDTKSLRIAVYTQKITVWRCIYQFWNGRTKILPVSLKNKESNAIRSTMIGMGISMSSEG